MAVLTMKVRSNAGELCARVEALAAHVNAAAVGDPIAEMAREIGEIDLADCVDLSAKRIGGEIVGEAQPTGALARLLEAFEARPQ